MSDKPIVRLASIKNAQQFREHLDALHVDIPCDAEIHSGGESPLLLPLERGGVKIGNRIAIIFERMIVCSRPTCFPAAPM